MPINLSLYAIKNTISCIGTVRGQVKQKSARATFDGKSLSRDEFACGLIKILLQVGIFN
jgi:hypothetical protein